MPLINDYMLNVFINILIETDWNFYIVHVEIELTLRNANNQNYW